MTGVTRRIGALLFVLFCAGMYFQTCFWRQMPTSSPSDFQWYYLAARHVLHGQSPFLAAGYLYPPLLAFVLTPLAPLDYLTARWIWFLCSHLCLLAAAWWMWRGMGSDRTAGCVVAAVWAFGGAAGESLALGQPGPLLTLLLAMAATRTGWAQGSSIAAGFAVKLIPGILCLVPALLRDWRTLGATVMVAFLLVSVPWVVVAVLPGPPAPASSDYLAGTPALLSWSIPSAALRAFDPPSPGGRLPNDWIAGNTLQSLHLTTRQRALSLGAAAATLLLGLAALTAAVRGRLTAQQVPMAAAACLALALAASPVCWTHYQVLQYPGVAVLLCYAARQHRWWLLGAALVCAALLYPVPVAVLRACYERANAWPNSPLLLYFWTSVSPVASLCLFGLMVRELSRHRHIAVS